MLFSKKVSIILSDDFNLAQLQQNYHFKVTKLSYIGYDLIHDLCFEKNEQPSYVALFSSQVGKSFQSFTSLVSPVHLHVGMNGLSLTQVLSLPREIAEPFLERLGLRFGISIKVLANNLWATDMDITKFGLSSNPHSVHSFLHENINETHDDQSLNEIQMFIRQDPIYDSSKKFAGEHVNSLWFWGAMPDGRKSKKSKPVFDKTFGLHPYFDALTTNYEIENKPYIEADIPENKLKRNNLMLCTRQNHELVEAILKKYKKKVTLYYRKNKVEIA